MTAITSEVSQESNIEVGPVHEDVCQIKTVNDWEEFVKVYGDRREPRYSVQRDVPYPFPFALNDTLDSLRSLLLRKNAHYGNSALSPIRIFARNSDSAEGIRVRIDDKLSRLAKGNGTGEGVRRATWDLLGYLVLLVIAEGWEDGDGEEMEREVTKEATGEADKVSP